ncbi:MAG TPA: hypothetical protein VFT04_11320 [Gemmatimonadales bacterium]|nr:hypothetical protein [Gemmatimonadales bacterium]
MKATALLAMLAAACNLRADRERPAEPAAVQVAAADAGCALDSVRPVSVAPAAGLWGYEDPETSHRVAAMIGPVVSEAGAARVTRRVETLESRPGADSIRHGSDTASLHLEFIPPYARPAAVYSIGALVRLAAYEPCGGRQQPLIRYLRQDETGRVTTDVLLQREAKP